MSQGVTLLGSNPNGSESHVTNDVMILQKYIFFREFYFLIIVFSRQFGNQRKGRTTMLVQDEHHPITKSSRNVDFQSGGTFLSTSSFGTVIAKMVFAKSMFTDLIMILIFLL